MKLLPVLMLSASMMAQGQSTRIDKTVTDNIATYHMTGTVDSHGCFDQTEHWNATLERCEGISTRITPNGTKMHCVFRRRGNYGELPIFCWYKPVTPVPDSKGAKP